MVGKEQEIDNQVKLRDGERIGLDHADRVKSAEARIELAIRRYHRVAASKPEWVPKPENESPETLEE